jgi:hypothetical protein
MLSVGDPKKANDEAGRREKKAQGTQNTSSAIFGSQWWCASLMIQSSFVLSSEQADSRKAEKSVDRLSKAFVRYDTCKFV